MHKELLRINNSPDSIGRSFLGIEQGVMDVLSMDDIAALKSREVDIRHVIAQIYCLTFLSFHFLLI